MDRQYATEIGVSLGLYGAFLTITILYLYRHPGEHGAAATLVALLPMLPVCGLCWAFLRALGRMDEMWRRIQLEGLSLAFAATALLSLSYGFLENVGFPKVSMFFVWPVMAVFWFGGCFYARRRYG